MSKQTKAPGTIETRNGRTRVRFTVQSGSGVVRPSFDITDTPEAERDAKRAELWAGLKADLRASGITWLALAGVDALKIQRRAGHASFSTTQIYIREAENLGADVGAPFGPMPTSFLTEIGAPDQSSGHSSERPSTSTEEVKTMQKQSGTRGSNPCRIENDQQLGDDARTIADGPGLARCTLDPDGAFAALDIALATGTWGES